MMKPIFNFNYKAEYHFNEMHKIQNKKFRIYWGSYLFDGKKYEYDKSMIEKQTNIYKLAGDASSVLEIGTYLGHSLLIMLTAKRDLKITSIDISSKYAQKACKYLSNQFPSSSIKFLKGNSLQILNSIKNKFDLFHIDGDHNIDVVTKEFNLCKKLRKKNFTIIFDDFDCCIDLINNILSTYKIIDYKTASCELNRNIFIKIQFQNNKLKFYYEELIFVFKSYFSFYKRMFNSFLPIKLKQFLKRKLKYRTNLKY